MHARPTLLAPAPGPATGLRDFNPASTAAAAKIPAATGRGRETRPGDARYYSSPSEATNEQGFTSVISGGTEDTPGQAERAYKAEV